VLGVVRVEPVLEDPERAVRVRARLHVEPHEGAVVARAVEDVLHDRDAEVLGHVHPHRRELDAHVRVERALVDAVEDLQVLAARVARLALVAHALAEEVERRGESPPG
jgi:hypothetical protein